MVFNVERHVVYVLLHQHEQQEILGEIYLYQLLDLVAKTEALYAVKSQITWQLYVQFSWICVQRLVFQHLVSTIEFLVCFYDFSSLLRLLSSFSNLRRHFDGWNMRWCWLNNLSNWYFQNRLPKSLSSMRSCNKLCRYGFITILPTKHSWTL